MTDDRVERVKDAIEEALTDEQGVRIYDAARAAIAECFKWRPIESAPKDGTQILLIFIDGRIESGNWTEATQDGPDEMGWDAGWISDSGFSYPGRSFGNPKYFRKQLSPPTHWMPRPRLPERQE